MTLGEVGFLKARGYSEPENSVPGLAQDLIYNLQPLQVGSVSQNHWNGAIFLALCLVLVIRVKINAYVACKKVKKIFQKVA